MESIIAHLHKASDGEDSYALCLEGDDGQTWRAERGYGGTFQKVWSVEIQSAQAPLLARVDWDAVLERIIEAYDLNDPVITDFEWPLRQLA
jgi:hypothetical protein